ncbi:hypothetical protein GGF44_005986, partial [Coemansia sp. RSA 1694]
GEFPRLYIFDQVAVFGRSPDCAVCFDDAHISLQHCTIERCGDSGSALVTNHSSNGTYVNSRRIEGTAVLNEGDQVVLLFDRIDGVLCDKTLLGQQHAVDSNGYPVLVGYQPIGAATLMTTTSEPAKPEAPPDSATADTSAKDMKAVEAEHKCMLERYAESQKILSKYSVMPTKCSDYMTILQRINSDNASDAHRRKQPLVLKKISDSYTEAYLPFKEDLELREGYINSYGEIRIGKLLEDLDRLAGAIAYKHASDANGELAPIVF